MHWKNGENIKITLEMKCINKTKYIKQVKTSATLFISLITSD